MLAVNDFKLKRKETFVLFGKIRVQILVASAALVLALFFAQLVFANNLATSGKELVEIGQEIRRLEEENNKIRAEIASLSSLHALTKKAQDLGFEKSSQVIIP